MITFMIISTIANVVFGVVMFSISVFSKWGND